MKKHYSLFAVLVVFIATSTKAICQRTDGITMAEATFIDQRSGGGSGNCTAPSGLKVAVVTDFTATLVWNPIAGASGYEVEVENALGNLVPYALDTTVADTACLVTQLLTSSSYKFKVRTLCGNGHSNWSAWYFFRTRGKGIICGVSIPTGLRALDIASSEAILTWNSTGAGKYMLEVEGASHINIRYSLDTIVEILLSDLQD